MADASEEVRDVDVASRLRALGFSSSAEALRAWLRDAHRLRLGPTETTERLLDLERRTRDHNNLARRSRLAMIGTPKALDQFEWQHPRAIDRGLYESLLGMDVTPS